MHLKRIDLLGFKSFPNKTTVKFSDGVTAIVGPNGCGKTNVLDALRWVLGEQKPTLLRGSKMEEIIFNGTRELKPLGMSEVTLSIVNDRGILPTEYHELQITRRLFRSGESEYLINKTPCRLKDITDLFVDTGMGAHSYSVIQQHMIDAVISDKAEERRFLFEEAAGITKYKQRRKAALRKLEATENDFLRLKDIYSEVKTRVNSLYRQHKKAERYKKLVDRIKAWDLYVNSTRYCELVEKKRRLRADFDSHSTEKTSRTTTLDSASARLESDRRDLLEIEQDLNRASSELYEITEQAHQMEREISVLQEKQTNAQSLIARNTGELEELARRSSEITRHLETAQAELKEEQGAETEIREKLNSAEEAQKACDERLLAARVSKESENKELLALEGQLSSGKTEKQNLDDQIGELTQSLSELKGQLDESLPRQHKAGNEIGAMRNELDGLLSSRQQQEARKQANADDLEQLIEKERGLVEEHSNLTASLEACQARKQLLEEMMLQYEGHESGTVAVMERRQDWPTLAGTVADLFVPVEGMETALESALGEFARYLVCDDRESAERVIDFLRKEKKGRAGILVPEAGTIAPAVKRPELELPGVVGWLDNFVSAPERFKSLKEAVLARTVVIDKDASTKEVLSHLPYGFSAVTLDGTLFGSNAVAGGSDDRFPLFRRKERISDLQTEADRISQSLDESQKARGRVTALIAELRADSIKQTEDLESIQETIEERQALLSEAEFGLRSLSTEIERLNRESGALQKRLEFQKDRQYSLGLDSSSLADRRQRLVSQLTSTDAELERLESEANAAAASLSNLKISEIEARSRVEQIESRIRHNTEILNDIENTRKTNTGENLQAEQEIATAKQQRAEYESNLKGAFERRKESSGKQETLRGRQAELQAKASEAETAVKKLRTEKDKAADSLHAIELDMNSCESELSSLVDRIRQEYETELADVQPEEPQENDVVENSADHIQNLKEKLRGFGAVNLLALQEYDEAAEREKFLNEQLSDLTTAKNELKSTISRINHTAKSLFENTLEKVQENFSKLFVDLFHGGEARISLVEPDDPLESDIDIIARPGGKKLLPITILSGGERALTAIALLFSLYLVKPSPFCILDEIDAPLDDANCKRFLKIIYTFSKQTQFIIITHNKITMEAANNLYGVTMEQPGVSQLVAVRFAESTNGNGDREVSLEQTAPAPYTSNGETTIPEPIQDRMNPPIHIRDSSEDKQE